MCIRDSYTTVDAQGRRSQDFIHFEALLIKEGDHWKILMEYQKSKAKPTEWKGLEPQ